MCGTVKVECNGSISTEMISPRQLISHQNARKKHDRHGPRRKRENAKIFVGTWNVNGQFSDDGYLNSWLRWQDGSDDNTSNNDTNEAPDIVAIGLQEIVDLNPVNVAIETNSFRQTQKWIQRFYDTLNDSIESKNDEYILVDTKYLVGILLCIFVKVRHFNYISCIQSSKVTSGWLGMTGNKGGVGIRMKFYDTTICFVNSHFTHGRKNVERQNSDYGRIHSKLKFELGNSGFSSIHDNILSCRAAFTDRLGCTSTNVDTRTIGINDHDLIFWMGDLNYGVHETLSMHQVLKMAKNHDLYSLQKYDSLSLEKKAGKIFQWFQEGNLTFKPTYKYEPGTNLYDMRQDSTLRAPGWCDRILWRVHARNHLVRQLNYSSSDELKISDHKPVMANFEVTIKNFQNFQITEDYLPSQLSCDDN